MINSARWDLKDALQFRVQDHFWMPEDPVPDAEMRRAMPSAVLSREGGENLEDDYSLEIECPVGIARVTYSGFGDDDGVSTQDPPSALTVRKEWLMTKIDEAEYDDLSIRVLAMNGNEKTFRLRKLLKNRSNYLIIPGTKVRLEKRSVTSDQFEAADEDKQWWQWAVLFNKMNNGRLTRATKIDCRVGILLDGAVVYFDDGHNVNCGLRERHGRPHHFGGHASQAINIPQGVEVVKLEIGTGRSELLGMRVYLSNGQEAGELHDGNYGDQSSEVLEPPPNHKIIGFYGQSDLYGFGQAHEFGIITAPRDVELPARVYEMKELQNTDGGIDPATWGDVMTGDDDDDDEYQESEGEEEEEDDDSVTEDGSQCGSD